MKTDVLEALRSETRPLHLSLEQRLLLTAPGATSNDYRTYLERMFGVHAAVERSAFDGRAARAIKLDLQPRRRVPLLERDLAALGGADCMLPVCTDLPALDTPGRLLGCLYVLEGATLGAQFIRSTLQNSIPAIGRASAYLVGYGADTGARWKEFRQALVTHVAEASDADEVLETARRMFAALHRWLPLADGGGHAERIR